MTRRYLRTTKPLYKEIKLSAGNGFADIIEDYNGYKLRFSRNTLPENTGSARKSVVCVMADGGSMIISKQCIGH